MMINVLRVRSDRLDSTRLGYDIMGVCIIVSSVQAQNFIIFSFVQPELEDDSGWLPLGHLSGFIPSAEADLRNRTRLGWIAFNSNRCQDYNGNPISV